MSPAPHLPPSSLPRFEMLQLHTHMRLDTPFRTHCITAGDCVRCASSRRVGVYASYLQRQQLQPVLLYCQSVSGGNLNNCKPESPQVNTTHAYVPPPRPPAHHPSPLSNAVGVWVCGAPTHTHRAPHQTTPQIDSTLAQQSRIYPHHHHSSCSCCTHTRRMPVRHHV